MPQPPNFGVPKDSSPLAGVNVNQYTTASFTYPLDLGAPNAGKDHYVIFHFNQVDSTGYNTATVNGGPPPTAKPTINQNAQNDAQYGIASTVSQPISQVATTVALYMPPRVVHSQHASWGPENLGTAEDIFGAFGSDRSVLDAAKSLYASGRRNAGAWLGTFSNMNINGEAGFAYRIAINDHPELLFSGIDYRSFSFEFRFVPQSEVESQVIANIIQAFKFYSAPEILQGYSGRYWTYPSEVDVKFVSNGQENLFLPRISTCAVTDLEVDYTPLNSFSAFRQAADGTSPTTCTVLRFNLKELEFITKDRVLDYY